MEYLIYVLFALFVALQFIDGYMTIQALKIPGKKEANPIVGWFIEKLGVMKGLVVSKGLVLIVLVAWLPTTHWGAYVVLNLLYAAVIWRNWQHIKAVAA